MKYRHFRDKDGIPVATMAWTKGDDGRQVVALSRAHTKADSFSYEEGRRIASDRVILSRNLQKYSMLHQLWVKHLKYHLLNGYAASIEDEQIPMLIDDLKNLFKHERPADYACRMPEATK